MAEPKKIEIELDALTAKLGEIDAQADGDIARIIELLLVENHVLRMRQSYGFQRGCSVDIGTFPRFLAFEEKE